MLRRLVLASSVVLLSVTACGGTSGSNTSCDLDGCTVTLPRDGSGDVSVLGVSAEVVDVRDGVVTAAVAGQTVTAPVGGETQVEGFTVRMESVTETDVVVRVTQ